MSLCELIGGLNWREDTSMRRSRWQRFVAVLRDWWSWLTSPWFRRRDDELFSANRHLRTILEEKNRRLATMMHDLKTPFLGIQRLSEMLLEEEELSQDGERKLELIGSSAAEAMNYVDSLLSSVAKRSDSNRQVERVNLAAVARSVVHAFEPHAERKDQALNFVSSGEQLFVHGSELELREAMSNLVSNALKFSPASGTVEVTLERQDEDTASFSVRDCGPGLSPSEQEQLFDPHERLSPEATAGESSSGLGLFFAKQIVEIHGGDIQVDSEKGKGCTFALQFPTVGSGAIQVE